MSQKDRVGQYLVDFGSMTALDGVRDLGVLRLSNRISELEELGWVIDRTNQSGKNRYGDTVTYMRYYFVSEPFELAQVSAGWAGSNADMRYISWFSCGAASATATKLALSEYGSENVRVVYQDTGSEHPDNERFLLECQDWFGVEVERHSSDKYKDIWDVFLSTRFLVGPGGARCTGELKRKVAEAIIDYGQDQQYEIFGYTCEEMHRVERFKAQNPERKIIAPLCDRGLTKQDCLGFVAKAGIELPEMYKLGYLNNNCIGCVKGQAGYWNKIRIDFPDVFERMNQVEKELGRAVCKIDVVSLEKKWPDIFAQVSASLISVVEDEDGDEIEVMDQYWRPQLHELPPDAGNYEAEPSISCGMMCELAWGEIDESA